jgi:hypothetical protein
LDDFQVNVLVVHADFLLSGYSCALASALPAKSKIKMTYHWEQGCSVYRARACAHRQPS